MLVDGMGDRSAGTCGSVAGKRARGSKGDNGENAAVVEVPQKKQAVSLSVAIPDFREDGCIVCNPGIGLSWSLDEAIEHLKSHGLKDLIEVRHDVGSGMFGAMLFCD